MELGDFIPTVELTSVHTNAQLRLDLRNTSMEFTASDAVGYEECSKAYEEAQREHAASQRQLLAALSAGNVQKIDSYRNTTLYTSWHEGRRQADNGSVFPVAYRVQAIEQDGQLVRHNDHMPVTVHAYPLYTPEHQNYPKPETVFLTGSREGMCYINGHCTQKVMDKPEVTQRTKQELLVDVHKEITDRALDQALQEYAEALAQQPGVDTTQERTNTQSSDEWRVIFRALKMSPHNDNDVRIFNNPQVGTSGLLIRFMAEKVSDLAIALDLLKKAISDKQCIQKIDVMLRQEYTSLQTDLQRAPGLEARYQWIIANLLPMKQAADQQVGKALHAHFKDTFMAALATEKAKTEEIRSLAASIARDTVPINDSIPASTQH
jgi:hypothetical protein